MPNLPIATIIEAATTVAKNKSIKKCIFGEYADGTPRSLMDALDGEFLSPKERKAYMKKEKKGNKKKKKHKKNTMNF